MSESLEEEIRNLRAQYWSARDPDGRAFAPLADAYRRKGDLDEAASLVKDGLGRLPDFASGHLVAARVARDRGESVATREHLDRVLELDPHNATALVDRAELLIADGDSEGGLLDLRTALDLEPENPDARDRLRALEEAAVSATLDVRTSPPGDEPKGPSGEEGTDPSESDLDPHYPAGEYMVTRTMGELYARQGLHDRAIEVFEQLLELSPEDEDLSARLRELRAHVPAEGPVPPETTGAAGSVDTGDLARAEFSAEGSEFTRSTRAPLEVHGSQGVDSPEGAGDDGGEGIGSGRDVPEGRAEETESVAASGPTISQVLRDLLAWVPGGVPVESLAPDDRDARDEGASPAPPIGRSEGDAGVGDSEGGDSEGGHSEGREPEEHGDGFGSSWS